MGKKKTQEEFVREVFDLVADEYEVLGEYKKNNIKIKIKHVKCKREYEVIPSNFLNGGRCPKCSNRKTHEEFVKEVFDLVGSEYKILGKYVGTHEKIKMKHVNCGCEWGITPNNFLSKRRRCPRCAGLMKKTTKIFEKEIFDLVGSEYEILGEYINALKKIKMKHVKCGFEWRVTPNSFLNGTRCPECCNSKGFSKGEKEIAAMISDNYKGTVLLNDKTVIPSMTTTRMYELDVYLPEIKLAIEYNGKYWHDLRELELPGYHDYKQRICDEKEIELINISDSDWKDKIKRKGIVKRILNKIK